MFEFGHAFRFVSRSIDSLLWIDSKVEEFEASRLIDELEISLSDCSSWVCGAGILSGYLCRIAIELDAGRNVWTRRHPKVAADTKSIGSGDGHDRRRDVDQTSWMGIGFDRVILRRKNQQGNPGLIVISRCAVLGITVESKRFA